MASFVARRAFTTTARRLTTGEEALKSETKKNPEIAVRHIHKPEMLLEFPNNGFSGNTLGILGGVMVAALAGAGFYFGRSPTKSTSESPVAVAKGSMPWETGSGEGKYQYHPGGDASAAPKDAPSAVNVVVVPDVNLPKVRIPGLFYSLHEKYNKWGKEGY
ncbi:hypothetical protein OQA88_7299 [Cercophora sp. LCS_1]